MWINKRWFKSWVNIECLHSESLIAEVRFSFKANPQGLCSILYCITVVYTLVEQYIFTLQLTIPEYFGLERLESQARIS